MTTFQIIRRILISLSVYWVAALYTVGGAQMLETKNYNILDGLASSHLNAVMEAQDGQIWLATEGAGLARFDGREFEVFADIDQLGGLYFNTLHQDDSSQIWAGGDGVLCRWKGGRWKHLEVETDIYHVLSLSSRMLVMCTDDGLWLLDKQDFSLTSRYEIGPMRKAISISDEAYVVGAQGLFRFAENQAQRMQVMRNRSLLDICEDDQGRIWILGEEGDLIQILRDEVIFSTNLPRGITPTFCKFADLGDLYVGTANSGVLIYQTLADQWLELSAQQLGFISVNDVTFDHWNNSWFATAGGGLTKMTATSHRVLTQDDGLSGSFVNRLYQVADQEILSIYHNGKADKFVGDQLHQIGEVLSQSSRIRALEPITRKWIGTDLGLYHLDDTLIDAQTLGLPEPWPVNDLLWMDSMLLIGRDQGLYAGRFIGDSLQDFQYERLFDIEVKKISTSAEGFWLVGEKDLACWDGQDLIWPIWPDDARPVEIEASSIGTLVASRDHGIFFVNIRGDGIELTPCPGQEFLPTLQVRAIEFASDEVLFIATTKGIYRTRIDSNFSLAQGYLYDETMGLPPLQISPGASAHTKGSQVYFGTHIGLLEISSASSRPSAKAPLLSLSYATLGEQNYANQSGLPFIQLPPGDHHIELEVKAIDHALPHGIHYFWRFINRDTLWQQSSSGGILNFLTLRPGRYQLQIKAENRDGVASNLIEIPFAISAPFYDRTWFIFLAIASLFVLLFLAYRWQRSRWRKEAAKKSEAIRVQNEMLRLEQAALKLQMNPHFIFNALQSIQNQISQGEAMKARNELQNFSKLMRNYLNQTRDETITLEEEIQTLHQYLSIERSLKNNAFNFEIEVITDIDPSYFRLPPMLIQPFVENAVKHGRPKEGAGHIQIKFGWKGRYLACEIIDNGPGFSHEVNTKDHRSAGMKVIEERLQGLFAGRASPLTKQNVLDEKGRIQGAKVTILLPVSNEEVA